MMADDPVVVIGVGPAGLTAANELVRHGIAPTVLEKADKVGGLARTESYKGYGFDIGCHRFFTKVEAVQRLWEEMLSEDFRKVSRLSSDVELVALARRELDRLRLARAADVADGTVVRQRAAYPLYDQSYAGHLRVIRRFLATLGNLQTIGRNGLHRHDN